MSNWKANWIWQNGRDNEENCFVRARKTFKTDKKHQAKIDIAACSEYRLYVNGTFIGLGPNPCPPEHQYYDTYNISEHIVKGENVIAVLAYNYGVGLHYRPLTRGGLLVELTIDKSKQGEEKVVTDDTWKIGPADDFDAESARMMWTVGFQQVQDMRHEPQDWTSAGFDDNQWESASVIGPAFTPPWERLLEREIPHLKLWKVAPAMVISTGRVTPLSDESLDVATRMYAEELSQDNNAISDAESVTNDDLSSCAKVNEDNSYIELDFGKEVVGFPVVEITSAKDGAIVDLGYSEALDDNGKVYPTRQSVLQADRFVLREGRQTLRLFHRRAFRYMQMTLRNAVGVEIGQVYIDRVGYPLEQVSSFECSDVLLNKIWETGLYTLSINMQDHYEDCPLREHAQYPGDARVQALMNYYSFNDRALAAKSLRQFIQSQKEDGLFNAVWPGSTNHNLPDYNLIWVMMLHDYILYTGDKSLGCELYENMKLLLDSWAVSQQSEDGLLVFEPNPDVNPWEWWLFIDHRPLDKRGEVAAYNAFYYQALRDAAKIAAACGRIADSVSWHSRAAVVNKAFNQKFWSEEHGAYVDCFADGKQSDVLSVQTNTLAVVFGLADSPKSHAIGKFLVSETPKIESSGPYFHFYVLQALVRLNMTREALNLIRSDWGEMLRRGATTWWETFDWSYEDGAICPASLCHAWSAAPTYFLPAEVLSIKPSTSDSEKVAIHPRIGDLSWAKGSILTRSGRVDVEWKWEDSAFIIEISAPGGFSLMLPLDEFINPEIRKVSLEAAKESVQIVGNDTFRTDADRYNADTESMEQGVWVSEPEEKHVRYEVRETEE